MNSSAPLAPDTVLDRLFLRSWRPAGWLALSILLVYGHTLFFREYTYLDDYYLIVDFQPLLQNPAYALRAFTEDVFHNNQAGMYYRPLLSLSLMLDAKIGGTNPAVFHLTNIVLHILVAISLMKLLGEFGFQRSFAFFVSLLFGIHPALTQTIAWIPGRNESLLTFFVLWSFMATLRFQSTLSIRWLFLSLLCFLLALFTKETALMMVPLLAVILVWKSKPDLRPAHYALFIIGWIFIVAYWSLLRKAAMVVPLINYREAMTIVAGNSWALLPYIGLVVWPVHPFTVAVAQDLSILRGIVGVVCLVALFLIAPKQQRIFFFFGAFWFLLFLLPSFYRLPASLNPMRFFEHRVYISAIGFFFMVCASIGKNGQKYPGAVLRWTYGGLCGLFVFLSFQQSLSFQNAMTLAEQTALTSPRSTFVHNEISMMHYSDSVRASAPFSKRSLSPDQYYEKLIGLERKVRSSLGSTPMVNSHLSLSAVYFAMGRLVSAEDELLAARSVDSSNVQAEFNFGVLYYAGHRERQAEQHWLRTVKLDSTVADAHRNLCYLYYQWKNFRSAAHHAQRAQELGADIPQELRAEIVKGNTSAVERGQQQP